MDRKIDRRKLVSDILSEYVLGDLSAETVELIQGWLAGEDAMEDKSTELKKIWNKIVRYESIPSYRARQMYCKLSKELGFPQKKRTTPLRRIAVRAAAVLLPVLLAAGGYFIADMRNQWNFGTLSTAPGEKLEALLPDGTAVWLNGDTRLAAAGKRKVALDGEAYFKVVAADGKPFVVESSDVSVIVLGTEFSLHAGRLSETVEVTLYKGRVRVDVPGGDYLLEPEQRFGYNHVTGETGISPAPMRMPEWMGQSMALEREQLDNIFASLEQLFGLRFVCDPKTPRKQLVTLKLKGNETIAETMFMLSRVSGNFTYEITENEVTVSGL